MPDIQEIRLKNLKKKELKARKLKQKEKANEEKAIKKSKKELNYSNEYSKIKNQKIDALIKKVQQNYKLKINNIKKEIQAIPNSQTKEELNKLSNSWKISHYNKKIKRIDDKSNKKEEKLKYKLKIAKINEEIYNKKINQLNIDKGVFFEKWDKLLISKKNNTTINKLDSKIKRLEDNFKNEVQSLEKRKKITPPSSFIRTFKDKIENFKSRAIFGQEIRKILSFISEHVRRYSMFYILAIIISIFAIGSNGSNLKVNSFMTIISSNTYILIIGLGMLLVIVGGYIDLSVGSLMGFMGAFSVMIYNQMGNNILITVILTVTLGALIGFTQGFLIGYLKMPAFIVTLGVMLLFQGFILTLTNSKTLAPNVDIMGESSYIDFVNGSMPDITIGSFHLIGFLIVFLLGFLSAGLMFLGKIKKEKYGLRTDTTLSFLMKIAFILGLFFVLSYYVGTSLFGLQYYLIFVILLIVLFIFITQNTTFGRKVYAIGGNKKAAQLSGIHTGRTTVYIFMITGALVGFAGIVFTAIQTAASPQVSGNGYELDVISAVFVGGASMAGGIGTIPGTIIGGLILGYINNGMLLMNFKVDMQKIIKSFVLLLAVGYDIYSNRKIG